MQSYPLDLATMLYNLRGQHGRLCATLEHVPGLREPCQVLLDLVEGKVTACTLMTGRGALLAEGARALDLLERLGTIDWRGAPIPLFLFGVWLKRRGKVLVTTIMLVVSIEILLFALIINYAGGLSSFALPFFDLLVIGDLFAVSLLPEGSVFLVAGLNIAFIVGSLFLLPKTHELAALLHTPSIADAIARPCSIQAATAVVTYLWVHSAKRALERADRATTIAALQQQLAQQG